MRIQPPGDYAIDEDEELIDGLSWLAYQRVATFIHLPAISATDHLKASLWVSTIRTRRRTPRGCRTGATRQREDPAMSVHRFAIGQSVRLKGTIGMALRTGDMFRITGRMPARNWSPQYRISDDEGRHERVAEENNLEEVTLAASPRPLLARSESSSPKWHNRQENVHVRVREPRWMSSYGMRSSCFRHI
jgi:hypothetical protein